MRRFIAIGAVAGLAVWVFAQMSGSDMLKSYSTALNGAKSLSATYTVQKIGGTSSTLAVDLAKPNKARIDTPTQLIVADGTNITTYTKKDNSYFKQPETDADLKALFAGDEMSLFAPFFDQTYFASKVVASKAAGQKVRKGVTYNVVSANMDNKGKKTVNFYLDPKDSIAKVGEFTLVDAGATDTLLVMTKDFAVNNTQGGSIYAFSPPDGAHEITAEEMSAGKWYTNLDEAAVVAKRLNKPMFVDFYADWWHFCHMLEQDVYSTDDFKQAAKKWVLVKINGEQGPGPGLMAKYGISGFPTIKYLKADGSEFGGFVGYMPTAQVVSSMNGAVGN